MLGLLKLFHLVSSFTTAGPNLPGHISSQSKKSLHFVHYIWRWLEETKSWENTSAHILNVFHCSFSTGSHSAAGLHTALQRGAFSDGPPEPSIHGWLQCTLHPFSPFSEIPLGFRCGLSCLFSELLLSAKKEGRVLHYLPSCLHQHRCIHNPTVSTWKAGIQVRLCIWS